MKNALLAARHTGAPIDRMSTPGSAGSSNFKLNHESSDVKLNSNKTPQKSKIEEGGEDSKGKGKWKKRDFKAKRKTEVNICLFDSFHDLNSFRFAIRSSWDKSALMAISARLPTDLMSFERRFMFQ